MTYRVDQSDPERLTKLRSILASPTLAGSEAWDCSDDEIVRKAEVLMNSLAGNAAALRLAARPIGQEIRTSAVGRLAAKVVQLPAPEPPDEFEQLMECAER